MALSTCILSLAMFLVFLMSLALRYLPFPHWHFLVNGGIFNLARRSKHKSRMGNPGLPLSRPQVSLSPWTHCAPLYICRKHYLPTSLIHMWWRLMVKYLSMPWRYSYVYKMNTLHLCSWWCRFVNENSVQSIMHFVLGNVIRKHFGMNFFTCSVLGHFSNGLNTVCM